MKNHNSDIRRRGSATVVALLTVVVLLGITGAMISMTFGTSKERNAAGARLRAFTAANSAVSHTLSNMSAGAEPTNASVGNTAAADIAGAMNSATVLSKKVANSVHFDSTHYWSEVTDNLDGTYTIAATGTSAGVAQSIQVIVQEQGGGVFNNAVFAGNSEGDPLYTLDFGGTGGQADSIIGDVFSGGSVVMNDEANVTGMIRASESVIGATGESNVSQPIIDLSTMDYAATADFNVADMFAAGATQRYNAAGGTAWELPESSPAHIFRKNPDDRAADVSGTVKDDYFIEDPYESPRNDRMANGQRAYRISFSGTNGEPGEDSNKKVFYIDGNLWLHNRPAGSFSLYGTGADGVQITFVVKGNIYMSDNLYYENMEDDGVAFVAMKDDAVEDSGNIYFGDPIYGTLEEMQAYMFAENNFYDSNLDESGSATVKLFGNMTAGNQVLIERDYGDSHTQMSVEFDPRIADGSLSMPGLPSVLLDEGTGFQIMSWHRVAAE